MLAITSIPLSLKLEVMGTTDTTRTASFLGIYIDIDSERQLRMQLYDKLDDFNFPIVKLFTYTQQNSSSSSIWSIALSPYQGCLVIKLKSSLRELYGRHHDLVNCYGVSVSQMTTDMFRHHNRVLSSFMLQQRVCDNSNTTGVTYGAETAYPSGAPECIPDFQCGSR